MPRKRTGTERKRGLWTEENLQMALKAIKNSEMSYRQAEKQYGIPRTTLRKYLLAGYKTKAKLGRGFTISDEQNAEFCSRLERLSEIGYPITTKVLGMCTYKFCVENHIRHNFNDKKRKASSKWVTTFLEANPGVPRWKPPSGNIVQNHFGKIETLLKDNEIYRQRDRLFNMADRGCRLSLNKESKVMAQREHDVRVDVVSCVSASCTVVPPMIICNKERVKLEFFRGLPKGSICCQTEKSTETFVKWIHHFAEYKPEGRCLVVFDGSKWDLDYCILDTAKEHDIVLYCLPPSTASVFQPLDRVVFPSFKWAWDQELLSYCPEPGESKISEQRFGDMFTKVWEQAMIKVNIETGFRSAGLCPFDPSVIPENTYFGTILENPVDLLSPSTPSNSQVNPTTQPGPSGKPATICISSSDEDDVMEADDSD